MNPLIEILRDRADRTPDRDAIRFPDGDGWRTWTWGEYWSQALGAAAGLQAAGVRPNDHLLMLVPDVDRSVAVIFGAWAAGAVPIQVGLPFQLDDVAGFVGQLRDTAARLDARRLVVSAALAAFAGGEDDGTILVADELCARSGDGTQPVEAPGPAFIQLTSGSLGNPRGVVIPSDRLMRHLEAIHAALPPGPDPVGVNWLPLFHDMGLVGGMLYPFYSDFVVHMMSPLDLRRRPYSWLQAMSDTGATHTAGPPSAFALATRMADKAVRDGLDLSALRCAMVGAEAIPPETLRRFAESFDPVGFRREAFFPVYGLAEATVAVTFPEPMTATRFDKVDAEALARHQKAVPSEEDDAIEFTGVGLAIAGIEIRVVDSSGADVPERVVGEIWVRTDSGMAGYYADPVATKEAFEGDWLKTGDLGYLAESSLFITGRSKELIIVAGRNLLPTVVEEVVAEVDGVRSGFVTAVGVKSRDTERAVVVAETKLPEDQHEDLKVRVLAALKVRGIDVEDVRLVAPRTLPRTTSGKLQRIAVAAAVEAGRL